MQRAQTADQVWQQELNHDHLAGGATEDDFTKFLELENDFAQFEPVEQQNAHTGLDTPMGRLTFGQNGQVQGLTPQQHAILQDMDMSINNMQSHMGYAHLQQTQQSQEQQYQQYQLYQQMQNPYQHQVPPTPVSTEMQAAKFAHAIDAAGQIVFDRQNATFTPLVSPAQTPIDNHWGMPDYVVAEDFFSPLTSPAIEAQQNYASTTATSSPVDLNVDQPTAVRKSRRTLKPTSRVASNRNLRVSPAVKGVTRRRQNSLTNGQRDSLSQAAVPLMHHLHAGPTTSTAVSSEDSVSPEPLSETSMRPPPLPQSRTPSTLRPRSQETNAPATPATLMQIPGKQVQSITQDGQMIEPPEIMEDISLGAAAAELPPRVLPALDTRVSHDNGEGTPTLSAKTPKLSADSTPRSSGAKAASTSQEHLPRPARGGRASKKRQSISQATVSPALRPKISPSISPLVPNTSAGMPILSAETSALYLASKSNYENIINGTHLPGVSYPETLAENLSSKRTSHKIAEQGRRNRINLALKEIESLLPASITAANRKEREQGKDSNGEASDKLAAMQGASKASTVEMAIIYIRSLQSDLQHTREKLEAAEKSLAEGNSSGSQSSEQTNA
ncbi:hypothetical protein LTS08_001053 [Lithohypha guttulata]|uniref:BHLH domain-containing protein n=1 Tax=Lithohypha guttulata TaxID=1690604 RepID=A0AAN7T2S1_9EURO|nr:hypothetical protein LTR05_002761 [Lithohypha guttulata]KAK5106930.1 hypothetical protein LTS08_001053 [Lithohypha guttulata]